MALLNKDEHKELLKQNVVTIESLDSVNQISYDLDRREMKIEFPTFSKVIISAVEFIIFVALSGFICWGLAYLVTEVVARLVH